MNREIALKIATAFGGGIARHGKTCGAVIGALMVIGLKYGRVKLKDIDAKDKTYDLVKKFIVRFKKKNNSIECKRLLNCDLSTSKGLLQAKNKKLFERICPDLVKDAIIILKEIL